MGLPIESGFMGVDIFFFISGYIVANVLSKKYFINKQPLKLFYINRFWRLYPTLITSMIFTLFLAITLQTGYELTSILKNVFYGLFGLSNLVYYKESGIYGTSSTDNNPLIHLWSLSVEFQFYLFFPFLYLLISKFAIKTKLFTILLILTLSLFLYTYSFSIFDLADNILNMNMFLFYMTPFRLFEFIFGVFAFNLFDFVNLKWNLVSKTITGLLFVSILYLFLITNLADQNKHEKILLLMLLLCCLIIFSKNKVRSEKRWEILLEKFGSYAYPIYLIHLPIITLTHIHFPENKYVPVVAGMMSLPIGMLIGEKIEKQQVIIKSKKFICVSFGIFLMLTAFIWYVFSSSNLMTNSSESKVFSDNYLFYYKQSGCTDVALIGAINCGWNDTGNKGTVFVAGDSQASHGLDAVIPAASIQNLRVISGARNGCPFIDDMIFVSSSDKCFKTRADNWLWIEKNRPKFVVIANLSTGYLKTSRKTFSNPGGKCPDINGLGCKGYGIALNRTVNQIEKYGSKAVILQTIPSFSGQFDRNIFDFYPEFTINRNILSLAREPSYLAEKQVSQHRELLLVDPFIYLCQGNMCPLKITEDYLYADPFHISTEGAKLLIPRFVEIFSGGNNNSD